MALLYFVSSILKNFPSKMVFCRFSKNAHKTHRQCIQLRVCCENSYFCCANITRLYFMERERSFKNVAISRKKCTTKNTNKKNENKKKGGLVLCALFAKYNDKYEMTIAENYEHYCCHYGFLCSLFFWHTQILLNK